MKSKQTQLSNHGREASRYLNCIIDISLPNLCFTRRSHSSCIIQQYCTVHGRTLPSRQSNISVYTPRPQRPSIKAPELFTPIDDYGLSSSFNLYRKSAANLSLTNEPC